MSIQEIGFPHLILATVVLCLVACRVNGEEEAERIRATEELLRVLISRQPWLKKPPIKPEPNDSVGWPKDIELRLILEPPTSSEAETRSVDDAPSTTKSDRRLIPSPPPSSDRSSVNVIESMWMSLTSVESAMAEVNPDNMKRRLYSGSVSLDLSDHNLHNIASSDEKLGDFAMKFTQGQSQTSEGFVVPGSRFDLLGWWDAGTGEVIGFAWKAGSGEDAVAEWGVYGGGVHSEEQLMNALKAIASSAEEKWRLWASAALEAQKPSSK